MRGDADALAAALVERSPNGILVTDAEGLVRLVNPALRTLVPVVPEPIGRRPIEAVPIEAVARALDAARTDDLEFEISSGHKDLLVRVLDLGEGRGRVAILQDVTRLRAADRYRNEFVANVSHELRTPATAIAGYAETLLEDREDLDPYVAEMVEVIHRNGRRLMALFDDLLVLARLDARQDPLPLGPVALRPVVAEAVDKVAVLAEERGITFEILVDPALRVRANREALGHVVGNLVHNAVKYSHDGGIVTVRAGERRGFVLLEVIDLGVGIDPAYHERIFERFFRVDKGRSRQAGGTGLGLSIVKKLVEMMGAAIEVRSRPGSGSIFRVLFEPPRPGEESGDDG